MSVTIDSLDIQIRSSAGSAAANIDKLASSLGRLKENAKLTALTNNLNKLGTALGTLQVGGSTIGTIKGLAGAMKSMSAIQKSSGLNSLIGSLKKLPEVVQALNAAPLDEFTSKIKELSNGLRPLATQIEKVGRGFSKLPSQVSKTVTAVNKLGQSQKKAVASTKAHSGALQKQGINLLAMTENYQNLISVVNTLQNTIGRVVGEAIEWDGIQYRFGQAFGENAKEVYEWSQKINEALGINTQQFMQYSGIYASLLRGFGAEEEVVATIGVGLTELTYDIWAFSNDRYKTLEEAAEAVRSAITGEIEPIRNAGIALTEASMQEYLDQIGMATTSVENLTEAQKAELRYAVMVNSAMSQGIVGTYAREMQTAEGAIRNLSQQLKTLAQAFGSLFIPILQKVVPWITAFVELLYEAIVALGALIGIDFQEIDWSDAGGGIGGIGEGAGEAGEAIDDTTEKLKKLKDYTMGFDELNIISPPSDTPSANGGNGGAGGVGSGGGLGLDLDTLWDDALLAQAGKQVDEIKEKIKAWFEEWKTEIAIIGLALSALGIAKLLEHLGEALSLGGSFLGVMKTIGKLATSAIIITLQFSLMTEFLEKFMSEDGTIWDYISALLIGGGASWILYSMWGPGGLVIGLGVTAIASLKAVIDNGGVDSAESATVGITGIASALGALVLAWKNLGLGKLVGDIGAFFALLFEGNSVGSVLAATFPKVGAVLSTVGTAISSALGAIAAALGISVGWVVAIIAAVIAAIVAVVVYWDEIKFFFTNTLPELWDKFVKWVSDIASAVDEWFSGIGEAIGAFFSDAWEKVEEIWTGVGAWFQKNVVQPIIDFFSPIVEWFAELFDNIWQTVSDVFYNIGVIAGGCWEIIEAAWEIAAEWFNDKVVEPVGEFFTELWSKIKELAISAWEGIKSVFSTISQWFNRYVITPVSNFFKNLWEGFKEKAKSAWEGVKQVFGKVASFFRETFEKAWSGIVSVFSVAGEIFVDIKDGIVSAFTKIVNEIIKGINKVVSIPFNGINDMLLFLKGIEILELKPFADIKTISVPQIPLLASGGFPETGQMFVAREAGPELVGKFGNRSAVVNNEQIIAGVAAGVYQAVAQAMRENSQQQGVPGVNVYLDGKQIYASMKKAEAERGLSLMGNQLGYSY